MRTFGWMILLRETGIVSKLLQWTVAAHGRMLNDAAIMVGAGLYLDAVHGGAAEPRSKASLTA